jgi:hypothetical protein
MNAVADFFTQPTFWWGGLAGALVTGVIAPMITARSLRKSDRFKAAQEDRVQTRKEEREDKLREQETLKETATKFSEVCSSVLEKAVDSKSAFNSIMDVAQKIQGKIDKKAFEKVEYAIDLMDEAKRITTAFNNLRVVAPVPVLQKASKLNAAMLALCKATTVPLAKPPMMAEAANAMEEFTNAVRAELGLEPYTAADGERAKATYMDALTKQMNDYIKQMQEDARRFALLEPGSVPITEIKAGDLTQDHIGKFIGCHDPQGFNYGAKIVNIIRREDAILLRLSHPPMPSGMPARDNRMRLSFDAPLQLVDIPDQEGG